MRELNINFSTDMLLEPIRNRYAFFSRPTSGLSNVVMDNYLPRLLYMYRFQSNPDINLPKTACAISPFTASYLGVKQISTEQLCRILGYSKKDIKNLINAVKAKNLDIIFAGYGGTGVNTIHWLTEMMLMTHSINLFNSIEIYENDKIEVSNILRFPKNLAMPFFSNYDRQDHKLSMLSALELKTLSKRSTVKTIRYTFWYNTDAIVYGAPDLQSRVKLFDSNIKFIAATHAGTSCNLYLNPDVDAELSIESYGLIPLTQFFMNQLRMSIEFLAVLASDQDLTEKDKNLFTYSFNGESKMSTDRVYNFQLEHSGLLSTEEEANATF